jgi:hypothetical protein
VANKLTLKTLADTETTDLLNSVEFDVDSVVPNLAGEQRKIRAVPGVSYLSLALRQEA